MQYAMRHLLIVEEYSVGIRADIFLAQELDDITRSYARTLIDKGLVELNGKLLTKGGVTLAIGDKLSVEIPPDIVLSVDPEDIPIDIVYEDEDIIVVNKPQGMVTHPAVGNPSGTLVNALMYKSNINSTINGVIRPGIVHRLDKDTTGLLVVAKNDISHKNLSYQISQKIARRIYVALVDGNIKEDNGIIDKPIGRSKRDRKLMAIVDGGRNAITEYSILERFGAYTLVEFELKTGRTHQIRVHAKSINHPVVGDIVYGGSNKFSLNGQLLHAKKLIINHPLSGQTMEFNADLPMQFAEVIDRLRKTNNHTKK